MCGRKRTQSRVRRDAATLVNDTITPEILGRNTCTAPNVRNARLSLVSPSHAHVRPVANQDALPFSPFSFQEFAHETSPSTFV